MNLIGQINIMHRVNHAPDPDIQEISRDELQRHISHQDNISLYRSFWSEFPKFILVMLAGLLVQVIAYTYPATLYRMPLGTVFDVELGVVVPLVALLPLALLIWTLRCIYDERHVVGQEAIIQITGLQGFVTKTTQIYFRNIRAIKIEQNGWQRLFNIGELRIGDMFGDTAGIGNPDITMRGIRNPSQVKGLIERRIRAQLPQNQQGQEEEERPARSRALTRNKGRQRPRQRSAH